MDIVTGSLIVFMLIAVAAISPGPDFLIVLKNSLGAGRKAGIFTALGIALGECVHITYCILGLALIISQSILLFNAIKWIGAAYLLYLGYKALRSQGWKMSAPEGKYTYRTSLKAMRQGFITNVLNPKATLFFLALFTQIITPDTTIMAQIWYGLICVVVVGSWFCIVSVVLTHKTLRQKLSSISIWIDRVTGIGFIALAGRLAFAKSN